MNVIQVGGTTLSVRPWYRSVKVIGRGSYGVVVSVVDGEERLAVKRVKPLTQQASDAKHALREIRCMRLLGAHPNIIKLKDLYGIQDELYIVMELMDSDLHRIIQSPQTLTEAHHRFFMYQLVRGVKYMHDHGIIHRDLKPGNLLVTRNCELKITDFGLARLQTNSNRRRHDLKNARSADYEGGGEPMTQHVVTRWYRPPELMLTPDGKYTNAVDVWSVGCVLAELLGRKPFFPGKNFVHQLQLIFNVIGAPRQDEILNVRNRQAKKFLDSIKTKQKVPFSQIFPAPKYSHDAASVLECLLVFAPKDRASASDLLDNHPYFHNLSYATKPILDPPATQTDFSFEHTTQISRLKDEIDKEVARYKLQRPSSPRSKQKILGRNAKIIPAPPHHLQKHRRALSICNKSSSSTSRSSAALSSNSTNATAPMKHRNTTSWH